MVSVYFSFCFFSIPYYKISPSDLRVAVCSLQHLCSCTVSPSLFSLSCCVVCLQVEVRRQRQPQRDYCVCLGLHVCMCDGPDGSAISIKSLIKEYALTCLTFSALYPPFAGSVLRLGIYNT